MKSVILLAGIFSAFNAISGPLGLTQGMTLEELKKQGNFTPISGQKFFYTSKTLTSGHPDFITYSALVTPEHGLCIVGASSKSVNSNVYGTELEGKFKELISVLTEKYGKPSKSYNELRNGSIWDNPQHWMMGLLKKERVLAVFWEKSKKLNLPDSMQLISVQAFATTNNTGFINIGYNFDNSDACMKKLKSNINSNL